MIDIKKIKNYTEPTWFLGTDIVEEQDLKLMEEKMGTTLWMPEGAVYHVPVLKELNCSKYYSELLGYSKTFQAIIEEALKRGYIWVFFDRDIATEVGDLKVSEKEESIFSKVAGEIVDVVADTIAYEYFDPATLHEVLENTLKEYDSRDKREDATKAIKDNLPEVMYAYLGGPEIDEIVKIINKHYADSESADKFLGD